MPRVCLFISIIILRKKDKNEEKFLGILFLFQAIHEFLHLFTAKQEWFSPYCHLISLLVLISIGITTVLIYFMRYKNDLIKSKKKYSSMFNDSKSVMILIEPKTGSINDVNTAALLYYGYSKDELVHMNIKDIEIEQNNEDNNEKTDTNNSLIFRHKLKNGEIKDVEVFSNPIDINGQEMLYYIIQDITKRVIYEKKLKYNLKYDTLTETINREYCYNELKRMDVKSVCPLSIIYCNIDSMRNINQKYGYNNGNLLLVHFANFLKGLFKKDTLISRVSGDSFIVVLPNANDNELIEKCSVIRSYVHTFSGECGTSLGCATRKYANMTWKDVLNLAEIRMNKNKLISRNSFRNYGINTLLKILDEKSHETEEHAIRLKEYTFKIAQFLELKESVYDDLTLLSYFHDMGKVATPDSILLKPDKLTKEEWDIMKKHSEVGARIISQNPDLGHISEAILSHHERWDGTGYPNGLKKEEIPLLSRIVSVADAFDAMINDRPYRTKLDIPKAIEELKINAGTQFDPKIVETFIKIYKKLKRVV